MNGMFPTFTLFLVVESSFLGRRNFWFCFGNEDGDRFGQHPFLCTESNCNYIVIVIIIIMVIVGHVDSENRSTLDEDTAK